MIELAVWVILGVGLFFAVLFAPRWSGKMMGSGSNRTSAGNALVELHKLLEPQKGHVLELHQEKRQVDDEQGEPPVSGSSSRE